jgi:hypothetical protein
MMPMAKLDMLGALAQLIFKPFGLIRHLPQMRYPFALSLSKGLQGLRQA